MKWFPLVFLLLALGCNRKEIRNLDSVSSQEEIPETGLDRGEDGESFPEIDPPVVGPNDPDSNPKLDKRDRFYVEARDFVLAHDKAKRWLGCNSKQIVPGGYNSNSKCGRGFLHPSFVNHLENHFYDCVLMAAEKAGLNEPYRVFMNHLGTYNDRPVASGKRRSLHAYARAMDISKFNLVDRNGDSVRISTHIRDYSGYTASFYNEFRGCWAATVSSSCSPGQTEFRGSVGHTKSNLGGNSLHADHIHLSFPFCAGS